MGETNVPRTLLISKNTLGSQSRILASMLDPQTVISEPNSMIVRPEFEQRLPKSCSQIWTWMSKSVTWRKPSVNRQ